MYAWKHADVFEDVIEQHPTEAMHRLVYADWLEEHVPRMEEKIARLREEGRILSTVPSYKHVDGFAKLYNKTFLALYIDENDRMWRLHEDATIDGPFTQSHSSADAANYVKKGWWKKLS
jgi:uncharacterized protein (TIGR02996 family)